ncbi:hypothetical protein BDN72DRAFT_769723 [Pluteus cervinus]|uniref:Uncharacterized protein n=1 Tax=Pluteus cervinus TaxID=181527 RepID=A0ACD3AT95_9AGAR|nr:hypothetical protein BDN72DRAFT_769723 [Pluteus cervinus]
MTGDEDLSLSRAATPRSNIGQFDGHIEGQLNCVALRHGWSRSFSVSPGQLAALDYATLEAILELNTLKLRASHLRIFVENPVNSGIFSKIRYWKDDGSLQSVLVKNFFEARMRAGGVVAFEIRDGHDREDTMSIKSGISGISGSLTRSGMGRDWLRRRGALHRTTSHLPQGTSTEDFDEDGEASNSLVEALAIPPPQPSRRQALMYFLGLSSQPPTIPPPKTQEQLLEDQRAEEAVLRKRGWLPPVIRKIASRRKSNNGSTNAKSGKSKMQLENPFFSASERNLVRSSMRPSPRTASPDADGGSGKDADDVEEMRIVSRESTKNGVNGHGAEASGTSAPQTVRCGF